MCAWFAVLPLSTGLDFDKRAVNCTDSIAAYDDEGPVAERPQIATKKITTYAGRSRRAMTEDLQPQPSSLHSTNSEVDSLQKAPSSPILSSMHTPFLPAVRTARTMARKWQPKSASASTMREPEQLILDLGQRIRIRCSECDMQYDTSSAEDCSLHARHHERAVKGLDWSAKALGVWGETVSQLSLTRRVAQGKSVLRGKQSGGGSEMGEAESVTIRCYDMSTLKDAVAMRKIMELLQTVDEALGAASVDVSGIQGCKVLVAVCAGRAAGAAVVGRVPAGQAREVLPSASNKENGCMDAEPTHSDEPSKGRATVWDDAGDAIFVSDALPLSKTPPVGIFRVHVIPSWRRTGLASALLDAAADNSVYGFDLAALIKTYGCRARSVAFSQPTEAGRKLAEAWIRRDASPAGGSNASPRLVVFEA